MFRNAGLTRRDFLRGAAAALTAPAFVPASALGKGGRAAPSDPVADVEVPGQEPGQGVAAGEAAVPVPQRLVDVAPALAPGRRSGAVPRLAAPEFRPPRGVH